MEQITRFVKIMLLISFACIILNFFPKNAYAMFGIGTQEILLLMFLGICLFFIVIWIWALIDILKSDFTGQNKIIWIIVVILLPAIGAILYALIGTKQKIR